jgi:Zn-dependent peptidase ImmA (M78 family)/transcriptional regulator with XRE-family HTH domain
MRSAEGPSVAEPATHAAAARVAPLVSADRLRLARELAGLTQRQVVDETGGAFTPAALSQLEKGHSRPSPATLAALAAALDCPVEFFVGRPGDASPDGFFRSLRSTSARARRQQLALTRVLHDFVTALEEYVRLPEADVPTARHCLDGPGDGSASAAEEAAEAVRRYWGLGDGPIPNVIRELERHGIVVVRAQVLHREIDAFSVHFPGRPIAVLGTDKAVTARSRFDAAHELGHFVMHGDLEPGPKSIETQAHQFAAAFLMPRGGIEDELPAGADWAQLAELKVKWRVSMAALLKRAHTLGAMSPHRYTNAMKAMSARGWRRSEPGDARLGALEKPVLLGRAVARLDEVDMSVEALCEEAALPVDQIRRVLALADDPRPGVDL